MLLEPSPKFFSPLAPNGGTNIPPLGARGLGFDYLFGYLWRYKGLISQLGLGLLVGSILQLVLPFLTQSVVDVGIQTVVPRPGLAHTSPIGSGCRHSDP